VSRAAAGTGRDRQPSDGTVDGDLTTWTTAVAGLAHVVVLFCSAARVMPRQPIAAAAPLRCGLL
jgi:hypothetical protein